MNALLTWQAACTAWACLAGTAAGCASMLVYRELSPQDRLRRLSDEIAGVRKQLTSYDGSFSGALALTGLNLRLSFRRVGYALWPAVGSGIPVLLGLPAIGDRIAAYLLAVFATGLAVKFQLKIA